ncbi:MAG TPA: serine hydrolase domain-containing protein, partial [Candidatus Dormibacteraeota bacterium]|nr:serine hydrolase domain-containing protein [Candidatus Dormibacteraeota bacterium]
MPTNPAFDLVSDWEDEGVIPGAALRIGRRGEVVFEGYVGLADRKRAVHARADTLWSIASITKPVTVAAMMACVDRGLLAVDEPLHAVLPEFARPGDRRPWRRDVTLRHLVTHTSG